MNASKAPAGGMTSKVNGQFYEGGEFMPVTGEYCGLGRNRVSVQQVAEANRTLSVGMIRWNEKAGQFQLWVEVTLRDGTKTEQVRFSSSNIKTLQRLGA
jgi:hypothetical protein